MNAIDYLIRSEYAFTYKQDEHNIIEIALEDKSTILTKYVAFYDVSNIIYNTETEDITLTDNESWEIATIYKGLNIDAILCNGKFLYNMR